MAKQVADVYGSALFEVACEDNKIDDYLAQVMAVGKAIDENPELVAMMTHPQISVEEKLDVLESVFEGRIFEEFFGLLSMLLVKGHFAEVENVLEYFVVRTKAYKNIGVVYVATPLPLSGKQKKAVEKKILETTDFATLEMNYEIDESLIGGMIIRIGDRVVDSSIKTKLENLSRSLAAGR